MSPPTNKEIVIAVMGVTGSGKSSLIQEITGDPSVGVSHSLSSFTAKVTPYTFLHNGVNVTLVDTPGFSDTSRSDVDILKEISAWATKTYATGHLAGVLYLQRISDNRMDGSALRSLRLLRSLVGEKNMKNVLLTTTHWSSVKPDEGERREKELKEKENFWKGLLDHGATLARYDGHRQSGLELLNKIIPSELHVLDIQDELVDKGKKLAETSAGKSVIEDLKRIEEGYEREIAKMREEVREAVAVGDGKMKDSLERERREIAAKIQNIREAQSDLSKAKSPAKALLYVDELPLLPKREALLIYVKATLEIGNVGLSGSLLCSMLDPQLRSRLAIQGVYYNPVKGVFSLLSGGSRRATQGVLKAVREGIECWPRKKIFLCGYGQGAMITRRALSKLRDSERARITGLVFFGQHTSSDLTVPKNLEDRFLNIPLPPDALGLPTLVSSRITYRCRELAFPAIISFIEGKMSG